VPGELPDVRVRDRVRMSEVENALVAREVGLFQDLAENNVGGRGCGAGSVLQQSLDVVYAVRPPHVADDDAAIRAGASLEVRVADLLKAGQYLQDGVRWGGGGGATVEGVQLAAKNIADGRHRVAEVLDLLARLVERVAHPRMIIVDGVAQMLHHAQLGDVGDALKACVHPVEGLHDDGPQKLQHAHPRAKGDALEAIGVQAEERPLHASEQVLDGLAALVPPLHLPLCALRPSAQRHALAKQQQDLLQLGIRVHRGVQHPERVRADIR